MEKKSAVVDVHEVLKTLESVAQRYSKSSVEYGAVEVAAKALLFIEAMQKLDAFAHYLKDFAVDARVAVTVTQAFANREQADEWLRQQSEDTVGALVTIEGVTHAVALGRDRKLSLVRTVSPQELQQNEHSD